MWQLKILKRAEKALTKLDRHHQIKIINYLDDIIKLEHPHKSGKALTGKLTGLWRFRINDFRIVCKIDGKVITIIVLDIGHRKDIYE